MFNSLSLNYFLGSKVYGIKSEFTTMDLSLGICIFYN